MKGKQALLIVAAVFILPIAAAKLVLELGLYQGGATNHGLLFADKDIIEADWLDKKGDWRVVYPMPSECTESCKYALFQLGQIPIAVGPNRDRFTGIVLTQSNDVSLPLKGNPDLQIQQIDEDVFAQLSALPINHQGDVFYLADPLNNVILAYPIPADNESRIAQGKGLLSDLRKLMKLSKVG
ncbi:hypothetical protein [Veronia pacifica]|uniref:Cytochrome oxidase n=1 Tax=Veronia pacifica TaxID=1080227 RepID=A0A1C3EJ74_9GAMM|nr:hypothetical protein [Veronia pacifica]ODA33269.1 hypothetical protein A8L45_10730 [Veronia pacifica]